MRGTAEPKRLFGRPITQTQYKRLMSLPARYRNGNYLAAIDSGDTDVMQLLYDAGMRYYTKLREHKIRRRGSKPTQLIKYGWFLALTGQRISGPLTGEYPVVQRRGPMSGRWRYIMQVEHTNLKHFDRAGNRIRMKQHIPHFSPIESEMWRIITDDWDNVTLRDMFNYISKTNGGAKRSGGLTHALNTVFHAAMKTPDGKILQDEKISPHSFRHLRSYNLYHQYRMPAELVRLFFGWTDLTMLHHYNYMSAETESRNMLRLIMDMQKEPDLPEPAPPPGIASV